MRSWTGPSATPSATSPPRRPRSRSDSRFDGNQFAHIAQVEGEGNPLNDSHAFAQFQREINDRCLEGPNPIEVEIVGSYRFAD